MIHQTEVSGCMKTVRPPRSFVRKDTHKFGKHMLPASLSLVLPIKQINLNESIYLICYVPFSSCIHVTNRLGGLLVQATANLAKALAPNGGCRNECLGSSQKGGSLMAALAAARSQCKYGSAHNSTPHGLCG